MLRQITLRADDYGLDAAIDRGIIELLQLGRVGAVGCRSQGHHWPAAAQRLAAYRGQLSVGLQFNLTAATDNNDPAWPQLLRDLLCRRLDTKRICASLEYQLERFEDSWQAAPDFISSQHQVHILPQIRELVFATLAKRYRQPPLQTDPTCLVTATDAPLKCQLIRHLGRGFQQQAQARGMLLNPSFAGIYSFSYKADFRRLFNTWVHQQSDHGMIMCRPAKGKSKSRNGTNLAARYREFDYLASSAIPDLLACTDVCLQPLQRPATAATNPPSSLSAGR